MGLSDGQRAGLTRGPLARSQRAGLRRMIAERTVALSAVLLGADSTAEEVALGMRIDHLLTCSPGVGDDTAAQILAAAGAQPHKRLCDLTIMQRRRVAAALPKDTE